MAKKWPGCSIKQVQNGFLVVEGYDADQYDENRRRRWVAESISSLMELVGDLANGDEPELPEFQPKQAPVQQAEGG
jgi:hypothetical protein